MAVILIDGVAVKSPKVLQVDLYDVDAEAYRNTLGDTIRDRVAVKRKLNCEWAPLTMAEISQILKAAQEEFCTVTYPDPFEGAVLTKTFYAGDRSAPIYWKNPETGEYLWEGLKMAFIER